MIYYDNEKSFWIQIALFQFQWYLLLCNNQRHYCDICIIAHMILLRILHTSLWPGSCRYFGPSHTHNSCFRRVGGGVHHSFCWCVSITRKIFFMSHVQNVFYLAPFPTGDYTVVERHWLLKTPKENATTIMTTSWRCGFHRASCGCWWWLCAGYKLRVSWCACSSGKWFNCFFSNFVHRYSSSSQYYRHQGEYDTSFHFDSCWAIESDQQKLPFL